MHQRYCRNRMLAAFLLRAHERQTKTFDKSVSSGAPNDLALSLKNFHFSNIRTNQSCAIKPFRICLNKGFSNILEIFDKTLTGR